MQWCYPLAPFKSSKLRHSTALLCTPPSTALLLCPSPELAGRSSDLCLFKCLYSDSRLYLSASTSRSCRRSISFSFSSSLVGARQNAISFHSGSHFYLSASISHSCRCSAVASIEVSLLLALGSANSVF
ncbi:hypothetical protein Ahy_B10g105111 isoform C [Arachis hypogaea]|uniref:Uncharacterized protein n=1 Tax=Arachis hypogaea TaxID=3818 RepID=A0A444X7C4_ARAHY|nr:hypothetical protein Ahy_B10g105111 isoform C [Arachis hypogaea]